jgi:hypothetical protein
VRQFVGWGGGGVQIQYRVPPNECVVSPQRPPCGSNSCEVRSGCRDLEYQKERKEDGHLCDMGGSKVSGAWPTIAGGAPTSSSAPAAAEADAAWAGQPPW